MDLAGAKAIPLMGRPESWGGRGGKLLGTVPDGVLRQARSFFKECLREGPNPRLKAQVQAIDLILADREAHHPQHSLAL